MVTDNRPDFLGISWNNYLVHGAVISREWFRFSSHVLHYSNVELTLPELASRGSRIGRSVELIKVEPLHLRANRGVELIKVELSPAS